MVLSFVPAKGLFLVNPILLYISAKDFNLILPLEQLSRTLPFPLAEKQLLSSILVEKTYILCKYNFQVTSYKI